jgi:predicted nucleotide-binding protein (sugar kinase/HSP70/actin superfamily)
MEDLISSFMPSGLEETLRTLTWLALGALLAVTLIWLLTWWTERGKVAQLIWEANEDIFFPSMALTQIAKENQRGLSDLIGVFEANINILANEHTALDEASFSRRWLNYQNIEEASQSLEKALKDFEAQSQLIRPKLRSFLSLMKRYKKIKIKAISELGVRR